MAVTYKDINQLTQKSSVAGTEKLPVSDTQYITPSQIAGLVGSSFVDKTSDESVGGDKTFTDDIIVGDASNIKYGATSGEGFTKATARATGGGSSLAFTVVGEPKAFVIVSGDLHDGDTTSSTGTIAIVGDSTGCHGVYSADSTHQHNYSSGYTASYSSGILTISCPSGVSTIEEDYYMVYYYGSGTLTFKTSTVTPGSGVTSVTFTGTGLTEVPAMYACFLETAVNSESYRRVALYTNSGYSGSAQESLGVTFYSSQLATTTSSFSVSYNNGLVINSGGMNAGGYFHNPGTYTLYYLMASDIGGGSATYSDLADELSDIKSDISALETGKQDTLVSGTSIKTINSTSLLGSGNIAISSLPTVTATNNGQLLEVSNGAWATGRKITISSSEPTSATGNNGDIWIVI